MADVEFTADHGTVEDAIEELVRYVGTPEAQAAYLERYGPDVAPHRGPAVDPAPQAPLTLEELEERGVIRWD